MKKKLDSNKIISYSVMAFLFIVFFGGFFWGFGRVRAMEGTMVPNILEEGISPAPENAAEGKKYVERTAKKAVSEQTARLHTEQRYSCDGESIESSGAPEIKTTCLFIKNAFTDSLNKLKEDEEYTFGESLEGKLRAPEIDADEAEKFTCNYIYYECSSCGEKSDVPVPSCEKCGKTKPYDIKYKDEYELIFEFPGDINLSSVKNNFKLFTPDEMINTVKDDLGGVITVNSVEPLYNKFTVKCKISRLTDEITEIAYIKDMTVNASLTFDGDFAGLGTNNLSFDLCQEVKYSLLWPSIKLSADSIVIDLKNTDNLLAELECDDPVNTGVTWKLADSSIAEIDDEGYIKAGKTAGETTVTASFEFLGRTYTDTAKVYIRTPVESTAMKPKKAGLSPGETKQLKVKFIPSDASIKTVQWFSEDESIAKVDENGVVTAVAAGTVTVYSLSDDGYFRSTCEVTVE